MARLGPLEDLIKGARSHVNAAAATSFNTDSETEPSSSSSLSSYSSSYTHEYLVLIRGIVGFFKSTQDSEGRTIDPYLNKEIQYSTPCYAWSAAILLREAAAATTTSSASSILPPNTTYDDLLSSACLALTSSLKQLADAQAADKHGDFFTFPAMQAYTVLRKLVTRAESQQHVHVVSRWDDFLRSMDPVKCYQSHLHNDPTTETEWTKKYSAAKMNNWNIVNVAGEYLRHLEGFCSIGYVEEHLAAQLPNFTENEGLYIDPHGPMPYDHFPRIFLATMLHRDYKGKHAEALGTLLERSAWLSLLMQSPTGESPVGGRSSMHQWNDAQQCVTFEIFAHRMVREYGDHEAAAMFRRGARLAVGALHDWVRPSGEFYIVKNRVDPSLRHGFEEYSFHSQYNLLAASMLATAYDVANSSQSLSLSSSSSSPHPAQKLSLCAPAEVGSFVFQLPDSHHKIFANCGGLYLEIDTGAESKYDSTGLVRVHKLGVSPLVGPTASIPASSSSSSPSLSYDGGASVGIGWVLPGAGGRDDVITLSQFGEGSCTATLKVGHVAEKSLKFEVTYKIEGDKSITERYDVTPDLVTVTAVPSFPVKRLVCRFPAFESSSLSSSSSSSNSNSSDAKASSRSRIIITKENACHVEYDGGVQVFAIIPPSSSSSSSSAVDMRIVSEHVPFRGGYASIIQGEIQQDHHDEKLTTLTYTLRPSKI